MNINWKLRLMNKTTLTSLAAIIVGAVYAVLTELGVAPAIERTEVEAVIGAVITVLAALGVVVDPTTAGIGDSERAMGYAAPYEKQAGDDK